MATPPLTPENEALVHVTKITGTYFNFTGATLSNSHFVAGKETSFIEFRNCRVRESSIQCEAGGQPIQVGLDGYGQSLKKEGPGLDRRRSLHGERSP